MKTNGMATFQTGDHLQYIHRILQKTNISYPLIRTRTYPLIRTLTCRNAGVRNFSFSGNFAYVLNGRAPV